MMQEQQPTTTKMIHKNVKFRERERVLVSLVLQPSQVLEEGL